MADDEAPEPGREAASPEPQPPGERAGEFERYALIAALTVVVLCLLVWDRWHDGGGTTAPAPRPDRALRVEIGGDGAAKQAAPAPAVEPPRFTNDAPPPQPSLPAPPPEARTYTVKSGDNLNDIAKRELGAASRAQEIADLNALADPSKLKPGQTLKLPAK